MQHASIFTTALRIVLHVRHQQYTYWSVVWSPTIYMYMYGTSYLVPVPYLHTMNSQYQYQSYQIQYQYTAQPKIKGRILPSQKYWQDPTLGAPCTVHTTHYYYTLHTSDGWFYKNLFRAKACSEVPNIDLSTSTEYGRVVVSQGRRYSQILGWSKLCTTRKVHQARWTIPKRASDFIKTCFADKTMVAMHAYDKQIFTHGFKFFLILLPRYYYGIGPIYLELEGICGYAQANRNEHQSGC